MIAEQVKSDPNTVADAAATAVKVAKSVVMPETAHGPASLHVQIKLLEGAKAPVFSSQEAAGADLFAHADCEIPPRGQATIGTGVKLALPEGYYGRIAERSGLATKSQLSMMCGVVDSDYRGEVKVCLRNHGDAAHQVKKGDRIGQMIIERCFRGEFHQLDEGLELPATNRGEAGFGSTGTQ